MNNTFWKTLWNSFQDVNGGVLSFLGILISVIVSRFPAKTQIPLDINIIIGTFVLLILVTLTRALITTLEELETLARDSHIYKIPRIKVVKPSSFGKIYLAEYSRLISKDTFVSLYYLDGDYEVFVAIGWVQNVQDNGLIQILLLHKQEEHSLTLNRLENNDLAYLENTLVKPSISRNWIEILLRNFQ
ncbi:hypothetical protein POG22_22000 [Geitlerinema sp. CS-897]|nr:hypothetical protein [Geitlerinema sp. CS-897]